MTGWVFHKCINLMHSTIFKPKEPKHYLVALKVFYGFKLQLLKEKNISFPLGVNSTRTYVTGPYFFRSVF